MHGIFMPELIEDEDVIFSKDSNYIKQKNKEKKNPIFKRIKNRKNFSDNNSKLGRRYS